MSEQPTLTDVEIHFKSGDPLLFTVEHPRDRFRVVADENLQPSLEWTLYPSDDVQDVITVDPRDVRYSRQVTRQKPAEQPEWMKTQEPA